MCFCFDFYRLIAEHGNEEKERKTETSSTHIECTCTLLYTVQCTVTVFVDNLLFSYVNIVRRARTQQIACTIRRINVLLRYTPHINRSSDCGTKCTAQCIQLRRGICDTWLLGGKYVRWEKPNNYATIFFRHSIFHQQPIRTNNVST